MGDGNGGAGAVQPGSSPFPTAGELRALNYPVDEKYSDEDVVASYSTSSTTEAPPVQLVTLPKVAHLAQTPEEFFAAQKDAEAPQSETKQTVTTENKAVQRTPRAKASKPKAD